jgi:hypothetical protein
MLTLFDLLQAPLDTTILDTYFAWYRIKTLDEVPDHKEDPHYYLISNQQTQYYAREVDKVRLLQIDTDRFINKNFGLDLRSWMIESVASGGGS